MVVVQRSLLCFGSCDICCCSYDTESGIQGCRPVVQRKFQGSGWLEARVPIMVRISTRLCAAVSCLVFVVAVRTQATEITISGDPIAPASHYNILLFENLRLSFTGIVDAAFDDNINASENDPEDGAWVRPRLRMAVDWPLTPYIHLGAGAEVGYKWYASGDGEDEFIASFGGYDTSLKIDFLLGNTALLRVYDRFERDDDGLEDVSNGTDNDYDLNRNTLGARLTMPIRRQIELFAQVEHILTWADGDAYSYQDNQRIRFDVAGLWRMNKQFRIGPYIRYEQLDYDKKLNNDWDLWGSGATFVYQRESGFTVQGSVGYDDQKIDRSATAEDQARGMTADVSVRFATSRTTSHTLFTEYDRDNDILPTNVNYSEEIRSGYSIASRVRPNLTLRGDIQYTWTDESDAGERSDLWRLGVGADWRFMLQAEARFRYEFLTKDSDQNGRSYDRNRFRITLLYDF